MFMNVIRGLAFLSALFLTSQCLARDFHEPRKGSAERAEILDVIRPVVEDEMRGPVEFVVTVMRASSQWAFAQIEPQRPGGDPIDPEETRFAGQTDTMDGLTVYALLHFTDGSWELMDHLVGPTDVGYMSWPNDYGVPPSLLGLE